MDREGRIVLVNRRTEEMFGYERAELLGKLADSLVRKQARMPPSQHSLTDVSVAGSEYTNGQPEAIAQHKDGRQIPVEISFSPLESQDGLLVISIIRDISERIKRERRRMTRQAARRILAEMTTLVTAAPNILHTVCTHLEWDLGALWIRDRHTGQFNCLDSWHAAPSPGADAKMLEQVRSGLVGIALASRVFESGIAIWVPDCVTEFHLTEKPLESPVTWHGALGIPIACDDEVVGVLGFFSHEIREPDEPHQETLASIGSQIGQFLKRKQAEDAVSQSEARKAAILEAALDAIITIDHEGKIIEFNPAAESMFGFTRSQTLGRDMAELIIPPGWRDQYREVLARHRTAGEAPSLGKRLELSGLRADGKEFPVEVAVARIRAEGPPLFTGYIRDISERKQAEEILRQTEERFRQAQKMEAIGRLAGGVAHDFNNLLTVITGYSHLLLSTLPEGDASITLIQEIAKAAERAVMLTRQLLAFSRKQVTSTKVVDLNTIVTDMNKMLQRLIGEDISLVPVLAPGLHPIKVDPGQFEQVIMNLVINARDAMPQGGTLTLETANIELDETYTRAYPELQPGAYVLLGVSDTGCGMDETVRARIFEPFFTTKEIGKGTGLGLATVYGIVKQAGGHVAVYSEPGKGTTFKIYLPCAPEAVVAPLQIPAPSPSSRGTETVLVVEDEDGVRALTSRVLQKNGYKVLEARHGLEALQICKQQDTPVNLVVTDVVMPKLSGPQLAEQMRTLWPNLRVLFLSGYTDRALVHSGLLDANRNFLQKPFTPDDLTSKVREMLAT
jgi:PAS domain S-box-containing protein